MIISKVDKFTTLRFSTCEGAASLLYSQAGCECYENAGKSTVIIDCRAGNGEWFIITEAEGYEIGAEQKLSYVKKEKSFSNKSVPLTCVLDLLIKNYHSNSYAALDAAAKRCGDAMKEAESTIFHCILSESRCRSKFGLPERAGYMEVLRDQEAVICVAEVLQENRANDLQYADKICNVVIPGEALAVEL